MEPLTRDSAIRNLVAQRKTFMAMIESGKQPLAQVSVDYIDNVLTQLVPGYKPGDCCCEGH